MKVYRVEHSETRHGPYGCWIECINEMDRMLTRHSDNLEYWPDKVADKIPYESYKDFRKLRHGFESLSLLYSWFMLDWNLLKRAGYRIAIFNIPEKNILFGNKQVVFDLHFRISIRYEELDYAERNKI